MRSTFRTSALMASLVALTATAAQAQTGTIQATATVLTAITVTGATPLAFGNVTPGIARTVGVVGGGRFDLVGQASAPVGISFVLPTNLTGAGNLAIGTWTGYHNTTNNASTGGTAFTPSSATTSSAFSTGGTLWVFVGATVSPTVGQAAGAYTGTVQLTAAYF